MHQSTQKERHECRGLFAELESRDAGMVDVSEEEVVDGTVPVAGVLVPGYGVPPVAVEAAVGEEGAFGEDVEDAFPD